MKIVRSVSGHYLVHECPGCKDTHLIPDYDGSRVRWTFNGDFERPTLSPSIKTEWTTSKRSHICHYFIRDGKIEFCGDCTHDLSGQTVPLPDVTDNDW